jgi:hypothetical protein
MAADRIELGDFDATQQTLRRALGYLSLGLEFRLRPAQGAAAEGAGERAADAQRAAQVLAEVPLLYLFRLGYSLTLQLRKLASLLVSSGATTLVPKTDPASLLLQPDAEPLRALLELRPRYSTWLEPTVVAARAQTRRSEVRPFQSLRELGRAAALLERLSAIDKLMTTGLGLRRDNLASAVLGHSPPLADVKLHDLLGTMVSNLLLDRPPALVPVSRRDLPKLRWRALGEAATVPSGAAASGELRPEVTAKVMAALQTRVHERALGEAEAQKLWAPELQDFVRLALSRLASGLLALPPTLADAEADLVASVPGLLLSR